MPHGAHTEVIEGQKTLVVERKPPLQPKLDGLLSALTAVTYRADPHLRGTSAACQRRDHPFVRFREGRHVGTDGIVRDLDLRMCQDCGSVAVHDVSYDLSFDGEAVPIGKRGPARRDLILGWYSGARPNSRQYR